MRIIPEGIFYLIEHKQLYRFVCFCSKKISESSNIVEYSFIFNGEELAEVTDKALLFSTYEEANEWRLNYVINPQYFIVTEHMIL